jgi:predicted nuclease of predicted toxin-antitoxin system
MKFFFDENFPKATAVVLDSLGHQYFDPRGTKFEGKPDEVLLAEARRLNAVFLTTDRDFFHTLRHEFPDHAGIIVIALKKPNRQAIIDRLNWLLENVDSAHLRCRAFQLRDRTWLARPPIPEAADSEEQNVDPKK